jgi:RNA recognition motif-containing protein
VTFSSHESAKRAFERLRGTTLLGSTLSVEFAREKEEPLGEGTEPAELDNQKRHASICRSLGCVVVSPLEE